MDCISNKRMMGRKLDGIFSACPAVLLIKDFVWGASSVAVSWDRSMEIWPKLFMTSADTPKRDDLCSLTSPVLSSRRKIVAISACSRRASSLRENCRISSRVATDWVRLAIFRKASARCALLWLWWTKVAFSIVMAA